jgi:hypothetical protein
VKATGWKAQLRLHARNRKLPGRELLGFIWAIGVTVEREQRQRSSAIAA